MKVEERLEDVRDLLGKLSGGDENYGKGSYRPVDVRKT